MRPYGVEPILNYSLTFTVVVWHIINKSINSHRPHKQLQSLHCRGIDKNPEDTDKYQRNYIRNQLISLCILDIPITRCLISERKRRTELVNKYQTLHQDVQLELKSLRIVFEHQDKLPAVLSKLRLNMKKKSQMRRAEKRRLVNRGEEAIGLTDEEASTERVG